MKKLDAVRAAVTSRAGRQILTLQKHSPRLMFAAGVVGFGATVFLAARATLKVDEVLENFEDEKEHLEQTAKRAEFSEEDLTRNKVRLYIKSSAKVVALYTPAFVVGGLSIASLTGAHVTLTRRNAGLTAAYVALDKGFRAYRERVVEQFGEEADRTARYDMVGHEIVEEGEHGPEVKQVKVLGERKSSIYARFFDESNRNWDRNYSYNRSFLRCQQQFANDLLRARGHVLLNDVYDMLGMERTKEGCVVGWVKGNADDYIDFGIFDDMYAGQLFVNGDERSILLDFNVDGVVYDLIGKDTR